MTAERRSFGRNGASRRPAGARPGPRGPGGRRGQGRSGASPGEPGPGLFRDVLLAPDRDRESGAWPVVSVTEGEDEDFERELARRRAARVVLRRRGREHGEWAVLRPDGLLPKRPRARRARALLAERHTAARPIFLGGVLSPGRARGLDGTAGEAFLEAGALSPWLEARLPGDAALDPEPAALADPERDLERLSLSAGGHRLWVKTGRLSTWPDDRSVRMRISFGEEGADDASRDEASHAAVAELGRALFPATDAVEASEPVRELLEAVLGGPFYFTQHIAYWNAPGGGALFHHDGFDEPGEGGQRGVLYVQVDGRTAWLALSLEDLASRVAEFTRWFRSDGGELDGLRDELFTDAFDEKGLHELAADWRGLRRELALPGCGRLAPLVNRGPEFTGFLADAGHGLVLEGGDALWLPNHGLERTAMHSVFHGGGPTGLGLSLAVRRVP